MLKNSLYHVILIIIFSCVSNTIMGRFDFRVALGPAWHNLSTIEFYSLSDAGYAANVPQTEQIDAYFELMPVFEARLKTYLGSNINIQVTGDAGLLHNGRASVFDCTSWYIDNANFAQSQTVAKYNALLGVFSGQVGYQFGIYQNVLDINPIIGYIYNYEKIRIHDQTFPNHYRIKNIWKGPCLGLELLFFINSTINVKMLYDYVFAHVESVMNFFQTQNTNPNILVPVSANSPCSSRTAPAHGNIFGLELFYNITNYCSLGTALNYWHYRNQKNGRVSLRTNNIYVSQATLPQITWKQFLWTFFVEYHF